MDRSGIPRLVVALLCAFSAGSLAGVASGDVLWSQPPDLHGFKASSEIFEDWGIESRIADDFSLETETTLTKVVFWGGYYNWGGEDPDPPFNIIFYSNLGCEPMLELAVYANVRTGRSFIGFDDNGLPTYAYEATVDFSASANTAYWCSVQACDHPYPPQWGRQQATDERLCQAVTYVVLNWPEWIPVGDVFGIPWDASLELRDDQTTPVRQATWGRVKQLFR